MYVFVRDCLLLVEASLNGRCLNLNTNVINCDLQQKRENSKKSAKDLGVLEVLGTREGLLSLLNSGFT